jgi:outer membrane immunogenic protein
MKKSLLTGVVLGALMAGNAMAADMPVKAIMKAPPMPVQTWTGCYLGGGAGYGMWNQDYFMESDPLHVQFSPTLTGGGRGWFGTAVGGCDYELPTPILGANIVIGAFADGDWGSIKGTWLHQTANVQGDEKESSAWAVGGRIGWLVTPTLLSYADGGYTQAHFDRIDLFSTLLVTGPANLNENIPAATYHGWFIGSGYEYKLPIFSGLYWRSEYRYSSYQAQDLSILSSSTGLITGTAINSKKFVQTVRSELVWRFNWFH